MKRYFGNWSEYSDVVKDLFNRHGAEPGEAFEVPPHFPTDAEVLFATYDDGNYSGEARMFWVREGQLYEWSGGHCSCRGLEDSFYAQPLPPSAKSSFEAIALRGPPREWLSDAKPATCEALSALVDQHISAGSVKS